MPKRVLIADSNEAFATMLKEGLEQNGEYEADIVPSAAKALGTLRSSNYDLFIADMELPDMDGPTLIQAARAVRPTLPIVVIPLFGEEVAPEVEALDIQGVLPKPFFIGDLDATIAAALEQPVGGQVLSPADRWRAIQEELLPHLKTLAQEVAAETVLLTAGKELIAHAGRMEADQAQHLAELMGNSLQAVDQMAAFLGEPEGRFEQSAHEGSQYRMYSLHLGEEAVLTVILSSPTPVGMVRYNMKRTAESIMG